MSLFVTRQEYRKWDGTWRCLTQTAVDFTFINRLQQTWESDFSMPERSDEEVTSWHEAGHAFVAVYLGGDVQSLSIDPDWDDGPQRFGDTTVHWQAGRFTEQQLRENAVLVCLAGPVVEMLHKGDEFHPATVAEWSQDWRMAWQAADFILNQQQRMTFLEQVTKDLYRILSQSNHWAAIGALVDHLLAYEVMEGETVHEIVAEWVSVR